MTLLLFYCHQFHNIMNRYICQFFNLLGTIFNQIIQRGFNYFAVRLLSITFYSKDEQQIGSVNYTLDFSEWLLARGLYRIEGVRANATLELIEEDEQETYEIEVVSLTSAARKKLLTFFRSAIVQESLTRSCLVVQKSIFANKKMK